MEATDSPKTKQTMNIESKIASEVMHQRARIASHYICLLLFTIEFN